jgi:hypothetical protein
VPDQRLDRQLQDARRVEGNDPDQPHPPPSDARWDAIIIAARARSGTARAHARRCAAEGRRAPPDRVARRTEWRSRALVARPRDGARNGARAPFGISALRLSGVEPATAHRSRADPRREGRRSRPGAPPCARERVDPLEAMLAHLAQHCPRCSRSDDLMPWAEREARWFRDAADLLHRAGVIDRDAWCGGDRCGASRRSHARRGSRDSCSRRIATSSSRRGSFPVPSTGGSVASRRSRTATSSRATGSRARASRRILAAGYEDASAWLAARSKTGLPPNVAQNLGEWAEQAVRITLFSGMTVLEEAGRRVHGRTGEGSVDGADALLRRAPAGALPGRRGIILVPFGHDALTVRSVVSRLGQKLEPSARGIVGGSRPSRSRTPMRSSISSAGTTRGAAGRARGRGARRCRSNRLSLRGGRRDPSAGGCGGEPASAIASPDGTRARTPRRPVRRGSPRPPALRARLDELGFRVSE